jgi:hypothetical protein
MPSQISKGGGAPRHILDEEEGDVGQIDRTLQEHREWGPSILDVIDVDYNMPIGNG